MKGIKVETQSLFISKYINLYRKLIDGKMDYFPMMQPAKKQAEKYDPNLKVQGSLIDLFNPDVAPDSNKKGKY